MGWASLLSANRVAKEAPSKTELDNLRSIVSRSLSDVAAKGLSDDGRFVQAYDAARTLSLIVVRAEGYRPKSKGGYHYNTFRALEAADPAFAAMSAYFEGCRTKRNASEYDVAGGVSKTEADGLLKEVTKFTVDVAAWMKTHHPSLA
ncbi:MAG: SAV_6107 family HEPN domain-containing protein [Pirellulales bacterium]